MTTEVQKKLDNLPKTKVTLVSTLPYKIREPKWGLIPSVYEIPAATEDKHGKMIPGLAYIADGYHNVIIPLSDDKAPPMKVTDTAEIIARSLIDDYVNANLSISYDVLDNGAVPIPGLFYVEGRKGAVEIELQFEPLLTQAKKNTLAWFERLVKLADDDWAKNKQYKMITDLQRTACTALRLQREWNFNVFEQQANLCFGCKSIINPSALVCANCGFILNPEEYSKVKHQFVTVK